MVAFYYIKDMFQQRVFSSIALLFMLFLLSPLLGMFVICLCSPFYHSQIRFGFAVIIVLFSTIFYASLDPFLDLSVYVNIYKKIPTVSILNQHIFAGGIEIIMLICMKVIYWMTSGSAYGFLLLIYLLIMSLTVIVAYKIHPTLYLMLFGCLFFSFGFVHANIFVLRQIISILCVFLLIFTASSWRILYIPLAFFSHISSLSLLSVIFLSKYRVNWRHVCRVFVPFSLMIVLCLVALYFYYPPAKKLLHYRMISYERNEGLDIKQIIVFTSVMAYIVLALIMFRKHLCVDKATNALMWIGLSHMTLFFLLSPFPVWPIRIAWIVNAYFVFFLYPILKSETIIFKDKYLVVLGLVILNVYPFLYTMYHVQLNVNETSFLNHQPFTTTMYGVIQQVIDKSIL